MNAVAGAGSGGALATAVVFAWNTVVVLQGWPDGVLVDGVTGSALASIVGTAWGAWLDSIRDRREHRQQVELIEAYARLPARLLEPSFYAPPTPSPPVPDPGPRP